MNKQPSCPKCFGTGRNECDKCGNSEQCESCRGTGIDASTIDLEAFDAASQAHGNCPRWGHKENGVIVGRAGGDDFHNPAWVLRYEDYVKPSPSPALNPNPPAGTSGGE